MSPTGVSEDIDCSEINNRTRLDSMPPDRRKHREGRPDAAPPAADESDFYAADLTACRKKSLSFRRSVSFMTTPRSESFATVKRYRLPILGHFCYN